MRAIKGLRQRNADSNHPQVVPVQAELLAVIDSALAQFDAALTAFADATRAAAEAFATEIMRRDDHRFTLDAVLGQIRAAFPGDRALHDLIVPDSGSESESDATPTPTPTPTPNEGPAPS